MKFRDFAKLFFLAVFLAKPSIAGARSPHGTTLTGVVQAVDHNTRWITFAQEDGPVRQFVYTRGARFWHGEGELMPAHLKLGMRVRLQLHRPFFGPDFVTHIVLLAPQPPAPKRQTLPRNAGDMNKHQPFSTKQSSPFGETSNTILKQFTNMKLLSLSTLAAVVLSLSLETRAFSHDSKHYPLHTCVVSGEKLGGDMGNPYVFKHDGTEVQLCCKSCLKDFNKDPAKYMAMVKHATKH
jgi:hypothetical protein